MTGSILMKDCVEDCESFDQVWGAESVEMKVKWKHHREKKRGTIIRFCYVLGTHIQLQLISCISTSLYWIYIINEIDDYLRLSRAKRLEFSLDFFFSTFMWTSFWDDPVSPDHRPSKAAQISARHLTWEESRQKAQHSFRVQSRPVRCRCHL